MQSVVHVIERKCGRHELHYHDDNIHDALYAQEILVLLFEKMF
jgi:hypothetical protein